MVAVKQPIATIGGEHAEVAGKVLATPVVAAVNERYRRSRVRLPQQVRNQYAVRVVSGAPAAAIWWRAGEGFARRRGSLRRSTGELIWRRLSAGSGPGGRIAFNGFVTGEGGREKRRRVKPVTAVPSATGDRQKARHEAGCNGKGRWQGMPVGWRPMSKMHCTGHCDESTWKTSKQTRCRIFMCASRSTPIRCLRFIKHKKPRPAARLMM